MLHQQLPQFLCQDVVCRRCDGAEGDEDFIRRGEVMG